MNNKLTRSLRLAIAIVAGLAANLPAAAQNATNGKLLYSTNFGTQNQGCANGACHGIQFSTLKNTNKIANGVNNPTVIQNAINGTVSSMLFLKPFLSASDLTDIAAYLGNQGLTGLSSAVAALAPTSLAFATTNVGSSSAAQAITLSNSGNAALTVSSLSASSGFNLSGGTCAAGSSVAAGASCTVNLTFSPANAGTVNGSLSIVHSAGSSTAALSGSGVALSPNALVSPASLSFTQVVASKSTAQTVTLSNTGTATLSIASLSLSGTDAGDFLIASGGTCAAGGSVAIGASCTVMLQFAPILAGTKTALLNLASNASPATVSLAGTATASPQALLSLNASSLSFGAQTLSSTSASQTLTLSNSGSATLLLSSLTLSGSNPGDFAIAGTCAANASIAAGASCTLITSFTPQLLGNRSASLTIASNASNGSAVITLGGSGAATPAAAVSLSPASTDFGAVTIGATGSRSVTLLNSGNATLNLGAISVSGNGFSGINNCGATLAAGNSCNLSLAFAPSSAAAYSGTASISSNATGSPHLLALSGSGSLAPLPVLAWQGAAPNNFGGIAVGFRSATQAFTLINQGPGAVTLNGVSTQGGNAGEFVLGGSCVANQTLAVNANCTVTVLFAPAAAGSRSTSLNIQSSGSNPTALALAGTGSANAQAALSWSATTLALPAVNLGGSAGFLPLILTNSGNTTVSLNAINLSNGQFSAQAQCGLLPIDLAPGQSCEIDLSVNLKSITSAGPLAASLSLNSSLGSPLPDVTVSGLVNAATAKTAESSGEEKSAGASGGGGCSLAQPGAVTDPVLWLMCLLSAAVLWLRRKP